jgi:hypothetical protein
MILDDKVLALGTLRRSTVMAVSSIQLVSFIDAPIGHRRQHKK